jgi:hypothetical protein
MKLASFLSDYLVVIKDSTNTADKSVVFLSSSAFFQITQPME